MVFVFTPHKRRVTDNRTPDLRVSPKMLKDRCGGLVFTVRWTLTEEIQAKGNFKNVFIKVSDDGSKVELLSAGPTDSAFQFAIYERAGKCKYSRVQVTCDSAAAKVILGKHLSPRFYEVESASNDRVVFMSREITHPVIGG